MAAIVAMASPTVFGSYAFLSQKETGLESIWPVVSLIVCASILAHGVTAVPLTKCMKNTIRKKKKRQNKLKLIVKLLSDREVSLQEKRQNCLEKKVLTATSDE